jgi:protein TonB
VSENRFLQTFCAVAASSVLVCGTLLLLTSTAPWTPPDLGEPSTPDASRDFAEGLPPLDTDASEEAVAALGSPLNEQSVDAGPVLAPAITETVSAAAEPVSEAPLAAAPTSGEPVAGDKAGAATDEIAGLLVELPQRVITSEMSTAATEQVADLMAGLPPAPPPVVASEKTAPGTEEVAGLAADLLPVPRSVRARETTEEVTADKAHAESAIVERRMQRAEFVELSAAIAAMPAAYVVAANRSEPLEAPSVEEPTPRPTMDKAAPEIPEADIPEVAVVELVPPPLPRRKPEMPPAPNVAEAPAPAAEAPAPVAAALASPPAREKPAPQPAQEAPKQPAAQTGGGLLGIWKPMTLAPADKPVAPAKPATARPSSGAYASQVWSRLARHKPRAGQRGSASVSFTIGELGALRGAQIARSSGNARVDQLALQTVRSAAPFPAPPSGAVSYTIRIDF